MTYDRQGRQHLHVSFEGVVAEHVYSETDGRLVAKRFFDNLQQYDGGAGTPSEVWTYTHDAFGRVIHVAAYLRDAGSPLQPIRFESTAYDAQGRIASVTTPEGTIRYTYDVFDRLTSTIVGTLDDPQRITRYAYDALGRLKTVSEDRVPADPSSPTLDTRYGYTLQGSLRRTDLPNGTIEHYVYDPLNRLDLLTHYGPDDTPEDLSDNPLLARFDYGVQADGRRTSLFEEFYQAGSPAPFLTNQIQWQYDALGRLVVEDFDSSDDSLDYTESFVLDLVGNRLQKTRDLGRDGTLDETTDYAYDANDRLWSEAVDRLHGDAARTEYDWRFTQQTGKTVYRGPEAAEAARVSTTAFRYDLRGRLEAATVTQYHDGQPTQIETTAYDYNSRGIRIGARTETDTDADGVVDRRTHVEFLNDANNHTGYSQVLRESHYETVDEASSLMRTVDYTFGHDEISQTVRQYDEQGEVISEETQVFGHDGHSSVRLLTDLAAAAVQFYAYDAYGQMLAIWNDAAQMISGGHGQYADPAAALTNLLYAGEQFDARIQQQYLRARYYDPTTGRFNRLDPFFGNLQDPLSFHKYLYAHADPINGYDPTGQSFVGVIGVFALGTLIGGVVGGTAWSVAGGSFTDGFVVGGFTTAMFLSGGPVAVALGLFVYLHAAAMLVQSTAMQPIRPLPSHQLTRDSEYAQLAVAAYLSQPDEVPGWTRHKIYEHAGSPGYRASLYESSSGEFVLAYAGTDDGLTEVPWWDWLANLSQAMVGYSSQHYHALRDAKSALERFGVPIRFVGHSLGGGLASAAAIAHGQRATTFNAAGLHSRTTGRGIEGADQLIDAYRVRGEVLSTLQDSWAALGWVMPNSIGTVYYLPATSSDMISRHFMADVLSGLARMKAEQ
jgi:RHS repeat-associated protein